MSLDSWIKVNVFQFRNIQEFALPQHRERVYGLVLNVQRTGLVWQDAQNLVETMLQTVAPPSPLLVVIRLCDADTPPELSSCVASRHDPL